MGITLEFLKYELDLAVLPYLIANNCLLVRV